MLKNVPSWEGLDEMALRIYFDAWQRIFEIYADFSETYGEGDFDFSNPGSFNDEWTDYSIGAQAELGAICATLQQAVELKLKSIVASVSPYLLILNGSVPNGEEVDFNDLRTLDAIDLPKAARSLTSFKISDQYITQYSELRKLRNKYTHLGVNSDDLTPEKVVEVLAQQYASLWPDGRWLARRVNYDGNSAKRFFHDGRYSSVESNVMYELPYAIQLIDNSLFKKCFGHKKSALVGHCPDCNYLRASKGDAGASATCIQKNKNLGFCLMCEAELELVPVESCENCSTTYFAVYNGEGYSGDICFSCGEG